MWWWEGRGLMTVVGGEKGGRRLLWDHDGDNVNTGSADEEVVAEGQVRKLGLLRIECNNARPPGLAVTT